MSGFDRRTRAYLLSLPVVEAVGDTGRISYAPEFRREVVRRVSAGESVTRVRRASWTGGADDDGE